MTYADNFFCMCQDEETAHVLYYELCELLHKHPAGPLQANECLPQTDPTKVIFALGYALVPGSGKLLVDLGDKARCKLRRIRREAHKVLHSPSVPLEKKRKVFRETKQHHASVINGYRLWKDGPLFHDLKMKKLRAGFPKHSLKLPKKGVSSA